MFRYILRLKGYVIPKSKITKKILYSTFQRTLIRNFFNHKENNCAESMHEH